MNEGLLRTLYWKEELSSIKIGHKLGVSPRTVLRWMAKFKIPRRSQSEALRGEKSPLYGKHLSKETRKKLSEAQKGEQNNASPNLELFSCNNNRIQAINNK